MRAVRFAVVGLNHFHIYDMVRVLLEAGGELAGFYAREPELAGRFRLTYPYAPQADDPAAVLEDPAIHLIVSADIPDRRAPLGLAAMRHGKDFFTDKPGFTTLEHLAAARRIQCETGRIYAVYYAERLGSPATVRAGELIRSGAIGRVVQTLGLGPHRTNPAGRPAWFFEREHYGGILADVGVHQTDVFLAFTGSTRAEVVSAQVGNFGHPDYPGLEDFGDAVLRGDGGTGYFRVDWFTPDGLPTWGDTRLVVLGAEGTIEVRNNVDLAGRTGGDHLFLVDRRGVQYVDCRSLRPPYPQQLLADVRDRTETAMSQAHCFLASELALQAEARAVRLGNLG